MIFSLSAFAALSALVSQVQAIPRVTRTGRFLYQEDGTRFYIKGIGYQRQGDLHRGEGDVFDEPRNFIDPLVDAAACRRDVEHFRSASINTLRVYSVDSSLNHDECMQLFSDANIYVILDLSLPLVASISRNDTSWSSNILNTYLATINAFEKYDNVIAYNIGNEVIDTSPSSLAAIPYIKAAARDVKAYLKSINSERLVGYAATYVEDSLKALAEFLSCGSDETAIDLFGVNEYTWCGAGGSLENSAYRQDISLFADYNVVAYFSEYGCVTGGDRVWNEVEGLLSEEMAAVWSGGIAFSYFPALSGADQYGLVSLSADNRTVTISASFTALGEQYGSVNGPNTPSRASAPDSSYPACVAVTGASATLPGTPNSDACNCLLSALSCRVNPAVGADPELTGPLTGTACGLLSGAGGSCADISSNGATGVYGRINSCGPDVKLSFVMSSFYEREGRNAAACSFDGNAGLNPSASGSAADAASSCIRNPGATVLPALPTSTPTNSPGGSNGNGNGNGGSNNPPANNGNNNPGSGATGLIMGGSFVGIAAISLIGTFSAFFVLV